MPLKQDRWSIAYLPSSLLRQAPSKFPPVSRRRAAQSPASCCGDARPCPPENQARLHLVGIPHPCLGLLGEAGGGRDREGRENIKLVQFGGHLDF
jgi:hypothetical protein